MTYQQSLVSLESYISDFYGQACEMFSLNDCELNALDEEIETRFKFENEHPFEWSDNGFGADLSKFVFN